MGRQRNYRPIKTSVFVRAFRSAPGRQEVVPGSEISLSLPAEFDINEGEKTTTGYPYWGIKKLRIGSLGIAFTGDEKFTDLIRQRQLTVIRTGKKEGVKKETINPPNKDVGFFSQPYINFRNIDEDKAVEIIGPDGIHLQFEFKI